MKNAVKILVCLLAIGLMLPAQGVFAQVRPTLHMFIIGDNSDGRIGAVVDFTKMQTHIAKIAELADMNLKPYYWQSSDLKVETLTQTLENLSCGTNDVVWFYYTGHGHNGENSLFGAFSLKDNANEAVSCSLDVIAAKIAARNPRLSLIMFDACNYQGTANQVYVNRNPNIYLEKERYTKLLRKAKGQLKASSNTAGSQKYSYGNSTDGGIFTNRFLQMFYDATIGDINEADWEKIMQNTKKKTAEEATKVVKQEQIPYFEMSIQYETAATQNTPIGVRPKKTMK